MCDFHVFAQYRRKKLLIEGSYKNFTHLMPTRVFNPPLTVGREANLDFKEKTLLVPATNEN